ncbi:Transcriptional regulatory protein sin3 [Nowakowskiella sp. JEL0407]|nr:Transcriptional regulatory protein sin3 [Nowakowskiella sp. JEL0407]
MKEGNSDTQWSPNVTSAVTQSLPLQSTNNAAMVPSQVQSSRLPPPSSSVVSVLPGVPESRQQIPSELITPNLFLTTTNSNRKQQGFNDSTSQGGSIAPSLTSEPVSTSNMLGYTPFTPPSNSLSQTSHQTLSSAPFASVSTVQDTNSFQNAQILKPQVSLTENERQFHMRPLNVKDALSYLDQVKGHFPDVPEVYTEFLSIMKDFKSQSIDTPGVIQRVSSLFRQHPQLIMGFNTFLPPGYRIEPTNDPNDPVKVSTPDSFYVVKTRPVVDQIPRAYPVMSAASSNIQTTTVPNFFQQTVNIQTPVLPPSTNPTLNITQPPLGIPFPQPTAQIQPPTNGSLPNQPTPRPAVEFNHAINYVNKIKVRYAGQPDIYKQFLEILKSYQEKQKPIHDVYDQVQVLFKNAPDLLVEFKQFLPEHGSTQLKTSNYVLGTFPNGVAAPAVSSRLPADSTRKATVIPSNAPVPANQAAKRTVKRGVEKAGNRDISAGKESSLPPVRKKPKTSSRAAEKKGIIEELEFFDRCKKAIGNKTTYTEFLKVLNLFSLEIIDANTLIARIEPFLSKAPELLEWFKKYVRREDDEPAYNVQNDRRVDYSGCKRTGASYRLLPNTVLVRSGLDDIGSEVLNVDWVSHPVYTSENGGFIIHHKNQFEENLYKCEDERYEFDLHIDANLSVIALLEPIARKIHDMTPEEKSKFKLGPTLGGTSNAIYKRVIKKIYEKARGEEIIELLQSNPAVAVPIVLKRLKQKDEEWKKSQGEWNKTWRESDARNHFKALDHQGIIFKQNDKKSIHTKTLQAEIESIYLEQQAKKEAGGIVPRHQMQFTFKDKEVFSDLQILIFAMLDVMKLEEDSVTRFLKVFLPRFFWTDFSDIGPEFEDDVVTNSTPDPDSLRPQRSLNGFSDVNVPSTSSGDYIRDGTQNNGEDEGVFEKTDDEMSELEARTNFPFYGTSVIYGFFRLYQMAYARLLKMKQLSIELADKPLASEVTNPIAVELGLQKQYTADEHLTRDRYKSLLKILVEFFEGKLDAVEFEDQCRILFSTSAYFVFTMDKLIQAIIKQITQIVGDENKERMIKLYYRDRAKGTLTARQEAAFRIEAENLALDEPLFRMEYITTENMLTMQAISKEDTSSDEMISKEEKWSMYVDHFVQIYPSDGARLKRREPFLRRNFPPKFPAVVSDEVPGNIETSSELELKICVNTYKIYFVENTEDYFRRKFSPEILKMHIPKSGAEYNIEAVKSSLARFKAKQDLRKVKKMEKFADWWGGEERGWRQNQTDDAAEKMELVTNKWMIGTDAKKMTARHEGMVTRYEIEDIFAGTKKELDEEMEAVEDHNEEEDHGKED